MLPDGSDSLLSGYGYLFHAVMAATRPKFEVAAVGMSRIFGDAFSDF